MKKIILSLILLLFPLQLQAQNIDPGTLLWIDAYAEYYGINNSRITTVNKFGHNGNIHINQAADIWSGGSNDAGNQIYTYEGFLSGYDSVQVVSTSGQDSIGNEGALTLRVVGLDSLWNPQVAFATLTGTDTTVLSGKVWRRVVRLQVEEAFADTSHNNGKIIVNKFTGDIRMAQIDPNKNQSQMAIFTIPDGYIGYIINYYAGNQKSSGAAKFIDIELLTRSNITGSVFLVRHEMGLATSGSSQFTHTFGTPLKISGKTDIKIRSSIPSISGFDVIGGFDMILIKIR